MAGLLQRVAQAAHRLLLPARPLHRQPLVEVRMECRQPGGAPHRAALTVCPQQEALTQQEAAVQAAGKAPEDSTPGAAVARQRVECLEPRMECLPPAAIRMQVVTRVPQVALTPRQPTRLEALLPMAYRLQVVALDWVGPMEYHPLEAQAENLPP